MSTYPKQQQSAQPPPPMGGTFAAPMQAPAPGAHPQLPMGVVQQFREDDPRWQCACGMHSRHGTKLVAIAKALIFAFQMVIATWYYYASIDGQRRMHEQFGHAYGDDEEDRAQNRMIFNLVWVTAVLLACLLVFVPLMLIALSASGKDKRWMLWPFLCLSACGIMGSVCSLNPLGFLECFFFYVIFQFDQYLKAKQSGVCQPAFVAVTTSRPVQQPSQQQHQANMNMYAAPAPAYQNEAPPAYEEAILTKKPVE